MIDEIDQKLIDALRIDSRVSFRTLSRQLGISTDTAARRYRTLEKLGIIRPIITIDYEKVGYQGLIFYFIRTIGQSNTCMIEDEIKGIPDVVGLVTAKGFYDLMATACVRNIKHAFIIGRKIKEISGIKRVTIDLLWLPTHDLPMFPPRGWENLSKIEE